MSRRAPSLAVAISLSIALTGCDERTGAERGAALFRDPSLSASSINFVACDDCHAERELPSDRILPGGSLEDVLGRPTYWGGTVSDPRDAVEACMHYFMRDPDRHPLSDESDPRGIDLLEHLETLGTDPAEPVAFTVPAAVVRDDLPAGDAARGSAVYDAACRSCHGSPHDGAGRASDIVPAIPDETIAEHGEAAGEVALAKIRHGGFYGIGGVMPPFSLEVLDEQQAADVLAFLGL